ncbi:GNAT family N-acetyltransferase [Nocardia sp. NPDC051570]|uniref:GNAT family N-acetyltransferase n=1 Tax=Nocardia sp. NPDC051570 TaxID=3364324 RepID=UPI0037BB18D8
MVDDAPGWIRTERLILRKVTSDDVAAMLDVHGDPAANVFLPDRTRSLDECRELLRMWLRDWAEHGLGYWAVDTVSTPETIGFGGLRHAESAGEPVLNLYYRFRPSAWGRGYASEMAAAAVSWAERARPSNPVEIKTTTNNAQSRRLAEKLGFVAVRTVPENGYTDVYLRRERPAAD